MSWHYQIRKHGDYYVMTEMYEDVGGDAGRVSWVPDPAYPGGETPEELIHDLELMLADARKYPVFEEPRP